MGQENHFEYLKEKRVSVLQRIEPICKAFGIEDYDYEISETEPREILRIGGDRIVCSCNSVSAVVDELIGWIFIRVWCRNRALGAFSTQTKNRIKAYWLEGII